MKGNTRRLLLSLLMTLGLFAMVSAQKVAVKNNLLYDALLTPNLSLEFSLGRKWTLDTQVGANFFFYPTSVSEPNYKTKKWSHWLVQPEVRYWTCDVFNGWFVGLHAHGGLVNLGEVNIPYFILQNRDNHMAQYRYESAFVGGGLSVGYHWLLSDRFSIEATVGAGYARLFYDKYNCATCGTKVDTNQADYVGPTRAAISLVYMFK